jgi:hypothetical protein
VTTVLLTDGYAGRRETPVEIVETMRGHQRGRLRVRLLRGAVLPRRGYLEAGAVITVPAGSVIERSSEPASEVPA